MQKVRITRQTVAQRQNVRPGDVLELADSEARVLVSAGKAVMCDDETPVPAFKAAAKKHKSTQRAKP